MGSCQNYGPFLGHPNNRCRTIIGTQKGTIVLTTTHLIASMEPEALLKAIALKGLGFRA